MAGEEAAGSAIRRETQASAAVWGVSYMGCEHDADKDGEHTCPFKIEIHDDSETLCDCCAKCTYECAMDV